MGICMPKHKNLEETNLNISSQKQQVKDRNIISEEATR